MQNAMATGRIVLQMRPSAISIDDYPEIVLEDGDKIMIPPQVKTVSVGGAIYNQSAYLYHSGMRVEDYVKLAGNGTRAADLKHLIVIRADGSILGPTGRRFRILEDQSEERAGDSRRYDRDSH